MADWGKILGRGNVEDRRMSGLAIGGGIGGLAVIATLVFNLLTGSPININDLFTTATNLSQSGLTTQDFEGADDYEVFTASVLGSTNEYWSKQFSSRNETYAEPRLVLFRGVTNSACGYASSEVGPHYCPVDQTIYIDETFFAELQQRFKAKGGDVAEAYVIAHEVGHHVQNQRGILQQAQQQNTQQSAIALELQADCYAGAWANSIADLGVFEPNEINEAIDAAAAVGDDRIQQAVQGQVNPETWTHGSSAARVEWFMKGYESGDPAVCVP